MSAAVRFATVLVKPEEARGVLGGHMHEWLKEYHLPTRGAPFWLTVAEQGGVVVGAHGSARSWRLSQDTYLCVRGFTEDVTATIWVLDGDLVNNAYSHEVVHVVDSAVTGKAGHCDWQQRGVTDSVFLLTGDPDVPEEEPECARRRLKDRIRLIEKQEAP